MRILLIVYYTAYIVFKMVLIPRKSFLQSHKRKADQHSVRNVVVGNNNIITEQL